MKRFQAKTRQKFKRKGYKVTGTLSYGGSHVARETTGVVNKFNKFFFSFYDFLFLSFSKKKFIQINFI